MGERNRGGQATLEFALVISVLVVGLLGVIDISFWGIDSMAATTAAENGTHVAVAAQRTGTSTAFDPAVATQQVLAAVGPQLRASLLGTPVVAWSGGGGCPSPDQVVGSSGVRVAVCVRLAAAPGYVTVRISGYARSLVPVPYRHGSLPIDEQTFARRLVFAA